MKQVDAELKGCVVRLIPRIFSNGKQDTKEWASSKCDEEQLQSLPPQKHVTYVHIKLLCMSYIKQKNTCHTAEKLKVGTSFMVSRFFSPG